jgi:uncharacterized protein (DUF927 family)
MLCKEEPAASQTAGFANNKTRLQDYTRTARRLVANGYLIVPILPGTKRPAIDNWQNARLTIADIEQFRGRGVGVLCGVGEHPICAVDIDVRHEGIVQAITQWSTRQLGLPLERIGQPPKRLLVYRANEPGWAKVSSSWFEDAAGGKHRLEILGKGQQFVAYHVHPDTNAPYKWTDVLGGLERIPAKSLVVLTREQIFALLQEFERIAEDFGLSRVGPTTRDPAGASTVKPNGKAKPIAEGARNETLFRLAAALRAKGLAAEAIEAALLVENAAKCVPPLPEDEVRAIARSVGRYPEGTTSTSTSERCAYAGGEFVVSDRGVEYIGIDKNGELLPPTWICSPLRVVAATRDTKGTEWGRLLEWHDSDGRLHRWSMPMESLQGDGVEVRRELARLGVEIGASKKARELLSVYLQVWPVEGRACCVGRLGWHNGAFVLPEKVFGESDELIVLQASTYLEPAHAQSGSVEDWRASVAALAAKNSRLVFAISTALAAPLLDVVGEESGGFHLRGESSTGKTTALKVAASVWGHPNAYPRLWRATTNGLEGLAALHNDGLLILDELSQIDPKEAGEAAYLLANGQGKARATRLGTARTAARWRLLFLSSGEESLSALMGRAGRRANAGQEVRLAEIAADAGAGLGLFEDLHGYSSPAAFALAIRDAATRHHGVVGVEWIKRLVADRTKVAELVAEGLKRFVQSVCPLSAEGQVIRVARRFGLVAQAGELATLYGLTGWNAGEALESAKRCFLSWLDSFGGAGNREARSILTQVKAFFEAHGASRFAPLDVPFSEYQRINNRAGFFREAVAGGREYLVLPEVFKREVCAGFDPKLAARVLIERGWLSPGEGNRATQKPRIPGIGPTRCYVLTQRMWEDEC